MLYEQYDASGNADWVWPVAASTLSTMHIMAADAYKNHGARSFCLVYDSKYHFGLEGEQAFRGEVARLGGNLVYEQPLDPNNNDYSSDVNTWNGHCSSVDFVGMLLEPDAAAKWLSDNPSLGTPKSKGGVAGAQPMFSTSLTANCGDICDGIKIFTGYRPIFDPAYSSLPSVERYASDVQAESSQADLTNQFLEGGYDGMLLTVAAFQAVGPNLTRNAVRAWLDSAGFDSNGSGLTQPLKWTPGHHFANLEMKAYAMVATSGRVTGYRADPAGFQVDPAPGQDRPN
jgi:ABC-type branched-subunit amino acid transport system substrate-binding protein